MKNDFTRREFLAWTAAGAAAMGMRPAFAADAGTGAVASSTFPEVSSALSVSDPSKITFLQITDLHFLLPSGRPRTRQAHRR